MSADHHVRCGMPRPAAGRIGLPQEQPSLLENYIKLATHYFLRVEREGPRIVRRSERKERISPMSIEDEFEETRRAIHRMLKDAFEGKLGVFREPFIYGFTTRTRESRLEAPRPALEGEEIKTRDPLVDVILTESAIFLTAEMPGVSRDEVRVRLDEGKLVLQGEGDRPYFTKVDLPADADRDTLKYTFTNGVLDVVIARKRTLA